MIGQTISHYPDKSRRDAEKRRKTPQKPGEGSMFENCPRTCLPDRQAFSVGTHEERR